MRALDSKGLVIVEDSDEDFFTFTRAFEKLHCEVPVTRFKTADECLNFLKQEHPIEFSNSRPSLILLDLNLPGTDGRDALREIKSDRDLKTIPVTVLTSSTSKADVSFCYESGANGYMHKDGNFQKFKSSVGAMVDYWFKAVILP